MAVEGDVTVLDERERSHGRKIVSTFQMSVGGINSCRVNLADFISIFLGIMCIQKTQKQSSL